MTDPWDEPVDSYETKPARSLVLGDYILLRGEDRLKVLATYSGAAGVPLWYVDAYQPGSPTRRIGCDPEEMFRVEVRT